MDGTRELEVPIPQLSWKGWSKTPDIYSICPWPPEICEVYQTGLVCRDSLSVIATFLTEKWVINTDGVWRKGHNRYFGIGPIYYGQLYYRPTHEDFYSHHEQAEIKSRLAQIVSERDFHDMESLEPRKNKEEYSFCTKLMNGISIEVPIRL
jgi:hypothetical protein